MVRCHVLLVWEISELKEVKDLKGLLEDLAFSLLVAIVFLGGAIGFYALQHLIQFIEPPSTRGFPSWYHEVYFSIVKFGFWTILLGLTTGSFFVWWVQRNDPAR